MKCPTKFIIFTDDTYSKQYSFILEDDDGKECAQSMKRYQTKAAASSVAQRMLNRWPNPNRL